MDKKKVMGHNPLAYSLRNHASFDFIRDTTGDSSEESKDESEKKPVKKVVSYYLEESIIERIKKIADEKDESYSSVAGEMLRSSIKKIDYPEG